MAAGRLNDAINAYDAALDLRDDPLVSGRMGLALMMWEDPKLWVVAARLLQVAVSDTAGVSSAERRQIFQAYERVRRHVCRLEVFANDVKSEIDIGDGRMKASNGAFWVFVAPGAHELIARLKDREDIRRPYECANGATITIHVDFPMPPEPKPKTITVEKPGKERTVVVRERAPSAPPPSSAQTRGRFSGGLGPVMVFGAATSPLLGATITGAYRRGFLSGMLGARGAWSVGSLGVQTLGIFMASGLVGPCVHWKWLNTCAFGSLSVIQPRIEPNELYVVENGGQIVPGIGIGVGAQYRLSSSILLGLSGDVTALSRELAIVVKRQNDLFTVWDGGRFIAGVSATLIFEP
jgi:hypothetical protein